MRHAIPFPRLAGAFVRSHYAYFPVDCRRHIFEICRVTCEGGFIQYNMRDSAEANLGRVRLPYGGGSPSPSSQSHNPASSSSAPAAAWTSTKLQCYNDNSNLRYVMKYRMSVLTSSQTHIWQAADLGGDIPIIFFFQFHWGFWRN